MANGKRVCIVGAGISGMGRMLDAWNISVDFRYKVLKPLFVNFVLASGLFDMPAALFARYLDFFDIESGTPMVTWNQAPRTSIAG